jgi:hypothetical protein
MYDFRFLENTKHWHSNYFYDENDMELHETKREGLHEIRSHDPTHTIPVASATRELPRTAFCC